MRKAFKWRLSIVRNKQVHWLDDWGMWLPLYDFKCWRFLRSFFFTEQLFSSFLYKLKLSVFQAAAYKNEWKSHSVLWLKGKLTKASENIFFPFFLLVNYCKSFFNDFFIFLLTMGDFLSWAALQIPFLPSSPPPSSSISPTAMREKK